MMRYHLFILSICCFSNFANAQYIQVNDSYTKEQLIEDVLINSDCATVSNISVLGGNFASGEKSYGFFDGTGTTFPFTNGIVLSTGRAVETQGPNDSLLDDGRGMDWPGDSDLERALEISNSVDATIIEFDFVPLGNKISFDYMLSSEEYHDNAPCRYSDGFAFLLKEAGSTGNYQNLAIIPGTTIPVKVTSVHPAIGGNGGCPEQNEAYFDAFNDFEHPTNFNGQTKPMTAVATVTPGLTYHIKLVIADEGNYRYDSAIFLKGGSFKVEENLGDDRLLASGNPLCENETLYLDAFNANAVGYNWFVDNNLIPSATNQPNITVDSPGLYTVEIQLPGTCVSTGKINVEYSPKPIVPNATLIQCDDNNDGFTFFNLTDAEDQITAGNTNFTIIDYFKTSTEAGSNSNPITNVTAFENLQNIVYARVENEFGCFGVSEITLNVSNNTLVNPTDLESCDTDSIPTDGLTSFNLLLRGQAILDNLPGGTLNYYTSYNDALLGLNKIPNPSQFINSNPLSQAVYAKLSSGIDCYGIVSFNVIVNSFGTALNDEAVNLCIGESKTLDAGAGFSSYKWNTPLNQITQKIEVREAGIYRVTVTNAKGCEGIKTFYVDASSKPEIISATINDFNGGNNSATINLSATSIGNYRFSLNGGPFQDSPTFSNLKSGEYTVVAKEDYCGTDSYTFYIMDYPKFFTPNADGRNDYWRIPFLQSQPNAQVAIFDRYGKLLYFFKGNQNGWDGNYNGHALPANDYWFRISLENGREVRGHFSLLR